MGFFGRSEVRRELPGFSVSLLAPTLRAEDVRLHTHENASFVLVLKGSYLSSADGAPPVCPTIMTMTAGNACDDNDDNSPGNEDKMQSDPKQRDWYKYTLDLAMLKHPGGEDAVYCSGDLNVVGGAVASATRTWLPQFFEQYLARPLQFGRYYLNLMPDGQAYMGGGSYLRPRDELKLGQLYLDGGVWNGKRILSKSWVEESTRSHSRFDPAYSLGQEHQYGYGWHINFLKSGGKTYRVFAAGGNGGQFVIVVPDLDLVVGINGGSYGEFNKWYRWELELVPQSILPAVTTRQ
jgi:CubicO group peptidase (beta-lactamase class C family)